MTKYTFQTINNPADTTFNQLLGIDTAGAIAGYFGSGAVGHPNQGYERTVKGTFVPSNFPGSTQTQTTGINNNGYTVGFYSPTNLGGGDANYGWVHHTTGSWTAVFDPLTPKTGVPVNQLLGINSSNIAVGFFVNAAGNSRGYTYNTATGAFSSPINAPAGVSTTATAINDLGDIAGFYVDSAGKTHGFLDHNGAFTRLDAPGFAGGMTQILGINNSGLLVGFAQGAGGKMFGVTFNDTTSTWQKFSDPNGVGTTIFNGINSKGDIVGFYVDSAGNTDGLLATPLGPSVVETGATAPSFDAWSLLAPDAGMPSGFHHETVHMNHALNIAVGSHQS
jgi:hypothetical protein